MRPPRARNARHIAVSRCKVWTPPGTSPGTTCRHSFDGHGPGMEILSGRAKTAHRRRRASPSTARSWARRLPTLQQASQAADQVEAAGAAVKKRGLSPPKMSPPGSYRLNEKWFARLLQENMEHYEELRDPVAHRKRIAAEIDFEI